jgi:electron transfer flavoprotein alpha subunit
MGNVLVLVEPAGGQIRSASLPAVTFGRDLAGKAGGNLILAVLGANVGDAAKDAARYGAAEVVAVDDAGLGNYLAETYAPIVARLAQEKGCSHVAATATAQGKDLLPRVAALLDCALVADAIGVVSASSFKRPMMAGNVIATVEAGSPTICVTVRQTAFEPAQPGAGASPVSSAAAGALDPKGASFVELQASKSERPELTEAKVVVSGGRGMREGKNFEQVAALADLLGGAMGASRAACDAGMVPNDLQVGQTGKVVAPQLYIAIAISGAIQHLAGMKGSKVIVAINKDAEAPIFQVADYGLVGTWEQAIPELTAEIKALKAART